MTEKRVRRPERGAGGEPSTWLYPLVRPVVYALGRGILAACGGMRVAGTEHVPRTGGVLVIGNHLSVCDPPVAALATPRPVWFLARRYLFAVPVFGRFIELMRAYPVDPEAGQLRALNHAVRVLRSGEVLVIYPEGRCSPAGRLQSFRAGAALIAWLSGAPVVPLAVTGTERLIPVGRYLPQRMKQPVTARFGPPLEFGTLEGLPRPQWVAAATRRMHDAVATLLAELPPPHARP